MTAPGPGALHTHDPEQRPRISAVMPFFNKAKLVGPCARAMLDAVAYAHGAGVPVEAIFVDHASTDGADRIVADEIARAGTPARLIRHVGGTVSGVRNAGVRASTGPLLCFIDSDIIVRPSFFVDVAAVGDATDAGAFGCKYDPPAEGHWGERVWDNLHNARTDGYRHALPGGDLVVRREAFDAVGGWDERLSAGEDHDLCMRLSQAGYRIYETRRLAVIHLGNPKSLREFYRKELWHGSGTLDSEALRWNRMTVMIYAFIASWLVAALLLVLPGLAVAWRIVLAVVVVSAVPAAAVAVRVISLRRPVNLPGAFVLYMTYFIARAVAMLRAAGRRRSPRVPQPA